MRRSTAKRLRADQLGEPLRQLLRGGPMPQRERPGCADRACAHPVHGVRPRHRRLPHRLRSDPRDRRRRDLCADDDRLLLARSPQSAAGAARPVAGSGAAGSAVGLNMEAPSSVSGAATPGHVPVAPVAESARRGCAPGNASSMVSTRYSATPSIRCVTWAPSAFWLFWLLALSGIYLYAVLDTSAVGAYRSIDHLSRAAVVPGRAAAQPAPLRGRCFRRGHAGPPAARMAVRPLPRLSPLLVADRRAAAGFRLHQRDRWLLAQLGPARSVLGPGHRGTGSTGCRCSPRR